MPPIILPGVLDSALPRRRLSSATGTPASSGRIVARGLRTNWDGYAPYKPEIVQKYLTILRVVNNLVFVGRKDRRTPAARGPPQRSPTGAQRWIDTEARRTIADELGHSRIGVVGVYCGS